MLDATNLYSTLRRPVMLNSQQTPHYGSIANTGHEDGDFLFVPRERAAEGSEGR